ncbi:NAD(P)/FAD-dependent oxidoreductase [Microbacterium betulae]|uniref:NAD(P)/FAD-dependent oxidoreductase n=1 Tax=Microbacterium betulae TaxID=2981139 RepID=A0AA97FIV6_9MICO|nr:NAD(P)/FAD-dependent oxidoreductase [Microbacterium sp. AB]WOF22839.1 NAD(P)/FAD-dependent oxidoreductase [Microbacterium sp. AB]
MSITANTLVTTEVLIVGAGFAGLGLGIRLKREGTDDFVIVERADDVGGAWRDNTYPGVACDVPSQVYSFSFRLNPHWSRVRAPGREIQEYLRASAREEGLLDHIRFGEPMERATWDGEAGRWTVETPHATYSAQFLVTACGHLADERLPDIPGRDTFAGEFFHSARWNHDVPLEGKRIALVGSGASGVQLLPELAAVASEVVVFQRSPAYIIPAPNPEYSPAQQRLFERSPDTLRALRAETFWTAEANFAARRGVPKYLEAARRIPLDHLERSVGDPVLRAKLTPDYELGCKRLLGSDLYYPTLQQDHVTLEASALARIDGSRAISAAGNAFDVDVIVFATGFEATEPLFADIVHGREGVTLADAWSDGMTAYASNTTHGFPNLFIMNGPNTSSGHNSAIYILEAQMDYILGALRFSHEADAPVLEVTEEAEEEYVARVRELSEGTVWLDGGCRNWYVDPRSGALTLIWPDFMHAFRETNATFEPDVYTVRQPVAVG